MKILKNILAVFFPSHCLACEKIISKDALFCSICWQKLQFITEPKCEICCHPFEETSQNSTIICSKCLLKKPSFDKAIAIFRYNYVLRKIITALKYHDQTFLAKKLANILYTKSQSEIANADFLTAVPLYKKRLYKRKFNQAVLLGRNLAKEKFIPDLLIKKIDTSPQIKLTKKQREDNLRQAFLLNPKYQNLIKNKTVILLDDVMTTGSTVENCAKELKKKGAQKVVVLVVARTII